MRVLLTGGSGFIGSNLVRALKARNVFTLSVDVRPPCFEEPDEFVPADVRNKPEIARVVNRFGPDYVIHLAAVATIQEAAMNPELTHQVNVEGTRSVMESSHDSRVIFTSTDKVYGMLNGKYTECSKLSPLGGSPYDLSKASADSIVRSMGGTVLRLCNIYGPCDTHETRIIPANIKRMLSGRPGRLNMYRDDSGTHDFYREMLHVDDLCRAVLSLIDAMNDSPERFRGQAFNIGATECYSMRRVIEEIRRSTESSLPPEIFYSSLERELPVQSLDISKARSWFNYSPSITISDGIDSTVQWWREKL